ncbi:DUF456 domain-containing protein [Mumia sp. ZJ1417]|uniref:DUF456 domain-containing protein n=1 Tax=Mumia sp. ZJ1417 TaxID=2708082 RepID=UPI001420ED6C|nr:DUF456 domain-containing protein [Mumia sp. ZJ1417]QMW67837.1 DUF456 domain-containing protein [Mumia sp. ZJ1417]
MGTLGTVLVGLAILVGLVGIVVPVLPGSLLIWAAIGVWAFATGSATGWVVFGVCTVLYALTLVVQYLIPGKRLKEAGVPGRAMLAGGVLGVVGFFVIPFVGLFVGFVLGVYAWELNRLRIHSAAWTATKHAMKAAGLSILIELTGGLLSTTVWVVGVVAT